MKYIYYRQKFLDDDSSHAFLKDFNNMKTGYRIPGGEGLFFMKYMYDSTIQNLEKHKYTDKVEHLVKYGLNKMLEYGVKEPNPQTNYTLEGFPVIIKMF